MDVQTSTGSRSELTSESSPGSAVRPPVMQLSPRWLTFSLIAVTLVPIVLALTVWWVVPATPETQLDAEIHLEPVSWPPNASDARLMPGLRIHNPTTERWTNVSMGINDQFYFYSPDPVEAGGDARIPLAFFRTSGNQAYRPTTVRMRKLTVYAQLPTGRRAILELSDPAHFNDALQ